LDWDTAIRRNRDQLKDIVAALFLATKMRVGCSLFTLPRSTLAMIMLVLRPAESAVRRLIMIAAHGLSISPGVRLDWRGLPPPCGEGWVGGRERSQTPKNTRAFKLFDPLKSFDPESIWDNEPVWESGYGLTASPGTAPDAALDHTPVDATHIGQRLNALMRALDTIPHQARRLARWQAKRDAALKASKPTRLSPMRPGLPPGWRERKVHEIDAVLRECHGLANDLLNST
jgi:hypothetical protein